MSETKVPWFVIDRSEAYAGLLLTGHPDIELCSKKKTEVGVSFLFGVKHAFGSASWLFLAEVRGTTVGDAADWPELLRSLFPPATSRSALPLCVIMVNVRDNHAWYAWSAEPVVESDEAKLRSHSLPDAREFRELTAEAVGEIAVQVQAWYAALSRQLVPG